MSVKIYAADFETTVYKHQVTTEVWSSAFCPVRTKKEQEKGKPAPSEESCEVFGSIEGGLAWLKSLNCDIVLYYHNLKFDGDFWIDWLLKHGYSYYEKQKRHDDDKPNSFCVLIGDMGQWYSVHVYLDNGCEIEMRDSLKLLPFSLRKIGKDFQTPHQKLEMEYEGKRQANGRISDSEMSYIKNDVLVLAEALEIMFSKDIDTLTIGSACMQEFRKTIPTMYYQESFMDLTKLSLDGQYHPWDHYELNYGMRFDEKARELRPVKNCDEYIREAYKGGWCYCKDTRAGQVFTNQNIKTSAPLYGKIAQTKYIGVTADVNSLYPSMMHSMSGNRYPIGMPHMCNGTEAWKKYHEKDKYTFLRFRCRFDLKPGFLPFVQIKHSPYYRATDMQKTSKICIKGKYYDKVKNPRTGEVFTSNVTMTMTCSDFALFEKHYDIYDLEILDGCWFYTDIGMFDEYINYWMEIKKNSKGAMRAIAKLFLNNLYGKFSTSPNNTVKLPQLNEEGIVVLVDDERPDKNGLYIPIGAAITSYARCFTINAAQANYDAFCYADTDSIHCLCSMDDIKGIKIHPTDFCCWKLESCWDKAVFVRQKTYIEHVCAEDGEPIEKPYYNIKCAGMPEKSKNYLIQSFSLTVSEAKHNRHLANMIKKLEPNEYETDSEYLELMFLSQKRSLYDFNIGLCVPGKLRPQRIPGGIVLVETMFTMNGKLPL